MGKFIEQNTVERVVETDVEKKKRIKRDGLARIFFLSLSFFLSFILHIIVTSPPREGETTETLQNRQRDNSMVFKCNNSKSEFCQRELALLLTVCVESPLAHLHVVGLLRFMFLT